VIRRGNIGDLEQVLLLERLSFSPRDAYNRRQFRHLLTRAQGVVLVDGEPGALRGFLVLLWRRGSRVGRIYDLAVHPQHRRQGVAQRLVEHALATARQRGMLWLRLEVSERNVAARALYEGLGFSVVRRLPDYYERGEDGLRYRRAVGSDGS
jgi:ribosomal protein S18 acetylase RimI-like enzyme